MAKSNIVYQLKITLAQIKPPIWRRVQVKDCTLDKLHEHIQTVMGWTNGHLHHFQIGEQLYGDPDLVEENFEEMEYKDSTTTKISAIFPKTGKRFRFVYEYDFGDSWEHEVVFEGCPKAEVGRQLPVTTLAGHANITPPFLPMARSTPKRPAGEPQQIDRLAEAVEALTHQVRQLALIMDEIREDLLHAVRNDFLNPASSHQWRPVASWDQETEGSAGHPGEPVEEEDVLPSPKPPTSQLSGQPSLFS